MARMRQVNPKGAFNQQRAELRRGARGKVHIGDDTGSAAARAAERAKVHRMQEIQHAREKGERLSEPLVSILANLVADTMRLARTFVTLPFRVAVALRGHRAGAAEA